MAEYQGKKDGSFGDIACFSFDGIKNITSGEGGCIISDDEIVLQKVRDARLLGVEKDTDKRYKGKRSWNFNTSVQGWRYHMSNIMAAIGIEQLKRFPDFAKKRQELAKYYDILFQDYPLIRPIPRDYNNVVPHIYVVRVKGLKNRVELQQKMLDKGIEIGYHYQPNHLLSLFGKDGQKQLPVTESIFPEILSLPLHPDITFDQIDLIKSELNSILQN